MAHFAAIHGSNADLEEIAFILQSPVFVFGQSGLMAGVQVEGQKITRLARN